MAAGASVKEDLSEAHVIMSVKSVSFLNFLHVFIKFIFWDHSCFAFARCVLQILSLFRLFTQTMRFHDHEANLARKSPSR